MKNLSIIFKNPEGSTVGETIAVLENVNSNLSLEDSIFTFV